MRRVALIALFATALNPARVMGQSPTVPDLSGRWDDAGRPVEIEQSGTSVVARFVEPPLCDPQDGSTPRPREVDFEGTLGAGDTIRGEASVCNYGENWGGEIGIQEVDAWLVLDEEGTALRGEYEGWQGWAPIELTREACPLGAFVDGTPTRESIVDAIVAAFRERGIGIGPEYVLAGPKHGDPASDLWTYMIRLDPEDRPLPSGTTILEAGEAGEILPGSQSGSSSVLLGSIEFWESGGRTRVMTRKVETETGIVGGAGKGDAEGVDPCAVAEAMATALEASGIVFGEPRGL